MSAAILQGVPATTLDTDLWIDLPRRQYIRVLNLCRRLGATVRANTVVDLTDGSTVNFLYDVHGLRGFAREYKDARRLNWLGAKVAVLPLERIWRPQTVCRAAEGARPSAAAGTNHPAAAALKVSPRQIEHRKFWPGSAAALSCRESRRHPNLNKRTVGDLTPLR